MMKSNLLTPQNVAERLSVGLDKARQIMKGLPHMTTSNNPCKQHLRIREEVLMQWLEEQERQTIGKPAGRKKPVCKTPFSQGDRLPRRKEG